MFSRSVFALVIIGFGFFVLSVMLLPISQRVNDLRTDTQTDNGLACTTAIAATSCIVTLSTESAYEPSAPNWTVTETSPGAGDKTADSTLGSNLQSVTISGLAGSTAYTFNATYFRVNTAVASATNLDSILKRFNLILTIGTMAVLVVGVGLSYNYSRT